MSEDREKGVLDTGICGQKWTLSKMLQILHADLFRCVQQFPVLFFTETRLILDTLCIQKNCQYLLSHYDTNAKCCRLLLENSKM